MQAVIDSVKGQYYRCLMENGELITIHKAFLPEGVHEGDILNVQFTLDSEGSKKQRELMAQMKA